MSNHRAYNIETREHILTKALVSYLSSLSVRNLIRGHVTAVTFTSLWPRCWKYLYLCLPPEKITTAKPDNFIITLTQFNRHSDPLRLWKLRSKLLVCGGSDEGKAKGWWGIGGGESRSESPESAVHVTVIIESSLEEVSPWAKICMQLWRTVCENQQEWSSFKWAREKPFVIVTEYVSMTTKNDWWLLLVVCPTDNIFKALTTANAFHS